VSPKLASCDISEASRMLKDPLVVKNQTVIVMKAELRNSQNGALFVYLFIYLFIYFVNVVNGKASKPAYSA
jgi:hypothetical protein